MFSGVGGRGSVSILHRNSSNGYYGNYLNVNARGEPSEDAVDGESWYRDLRECKQEEM